MPANIRFSAFVGSIFVVLVTGPVHAHAPDSAAITGSVVDAALRHPLEGVIVYLDSTPYSATTDSLGRFAISGIPAGSYRLIAARAGYFHDSLNLRVPDPGRDTIMFALREDPSPQEEVAIVADMPQPVLHTTRGVFVPAGIDGSYSLTGALAPRPFGVLFTGSALYIYAFDTASIRGELLGWFWMLYQNRATEPRYFDAEKQIRVSSFDSAATLRPLGRVGFDAADVSNRIFTAIESPLRSMAVMRTRYLRELERFVARASSREVHPSPPVDLSRNVPPSGDGTFSSILFHTFRSSLAVQLTGKYNILPGAGIHGCLMFHIPPLPPDTARAHAGQWYDYHILVEIITEDDDELITFAPQ